MNTTFTVDLIKGTYTEWPRLEDDDSIMVAGSYRPLEDAFRIAHSQLIRWVVTESGLSVSDAYQLISQIATSRIANVVDPNYTIVAKAPKRYLPGDIGWMAGVHGRLRAIGRAVLAAPPPLTDLATGPR
jgi:amidase